MIPREVYVEGIGRGYIRPVEYGDLLRYAEAQRTPGLVAELFTQTVIGLDVTARDVCLMAPWAVPRLERAIMEASDVGTADDAPKATDAAGDDTPEYREDAALAPPDGGAADSLTEADQVYWLHDQGYTYEGIYGLLIAEITQLRDGHSRAQDRREDSETTSTQSSGHHTGNRGDRAAQFGWR